MLDRINQLSAIANSPNRTIVGLMSGTSFDGLDIALCKFNGCGVNTRVDLLHFKTASFDNDFKTEIKSIFAKEHASLLKLTLLNKFIGEYFGELVLESLKEWSIDPSSVDIIASHGQTIYHAPFNSH